MKPANASQTARSMPGLLALCILLWLVGLLAAAIGIWLLLRAEWWPGALALLLAVALAAAGLGLYRLRRWGAVTFGVLALLGSASYLASTLERFSTLNGMELAAALWALANILAAILIPLGLIYVALVLWRQMR